ncbi:MAG: tetratricopeptide repeat protein [Calditrichaeota bacterium]|nr:MAG: tetratricopeptide repeat protein [Calditrichota bacterium]
MEAFLKLAQMYGEAGQFDQAWQLLESARKVDPRNPQVQQLQELVAHPPLFEAFTRISFGDLEGARPILERFVAEHPEHPQAWLVLGDVLRAEAQPEEALACYRKAGTPDHFDAQWLARQAAVLAELNRLEEALGVLEPWQQELRAHPSLWKIYIQLLYASEQFERTVRELDDYLGAHPKDPEAYLLLGQMYAEAGNLGQARLIGLKALQLAPQDPEVRRFVVSLAGEAEDAATPGLQAWTPERAAEVGEGGTTGN